MGTGSGACEQRVGTGMAKKRKGKGNKKRELDIGAIQDAFTQKLLFAAFAIKEEDAVRRVRTLCANETERIVETALRQNAALDISGLLDNANCYGRTPLQY